MEFMSSIKDYISYTDCTNFETDWTISPGGWTNPPPQQLRYCMHYMTTELPSQHFERYGMYIVLTKTKRGRKEE